MRFKQYWNITQDQMDSWHYHFLKDDLTPVLPKLSHSIYTICSIPRPWLLAPNSHILPTFWYWWVRVPEHWTSIPNCHHTLALIPWYRQKRRQQTLTWAPLEHFSCPPDSYIDRYERHGLPDPQTILTLSQLTLDVQVPMQTHKQYVSLREWVSFKKY